MTTMKMKDPFCPKPRRFALTALALLALCGAAQAQAGREPEGEGLRLSTSAFGTLGWVQSNRAYRYQASIDEDGTARRDSVLGGQLDAQLTPQLSATVQARLAPSPHSDNGWDLTASWAFLAWRPSNDWLVRLGKLRVPFVLRSEQLDVGATYDESHLPSEIYGLAPSNDFTGGSVARTWGLTDGDFSLELYSGRARLTKRLYLREGLPPLQPAGAFFRDVHTSVVGLAATWRAPDVLARSGLHYARTNRTDGGGLLVRPTLVTLGPGLSYWQTDNALPGPGVESVSHINNWLFTAGADIRLGGGWRLASELARVWQRNVETGVDAVGGYVTMYRQIGAFTPYATWARINSVGSAVDWSRTLESSSLPSFVPGAAQLNASMRVGADTLPIYRQTSIALGSSYTWSPRIKLKAEWSQVRASRSQWIDVPAGEPLEARRTIDAVSASISFVY